MFILFIHILSTKVTQKMITPYQNFDTELLLNYTPKLVKTTRVILYIKITT